VLTAEELLSRQEEIAAAPELTALLDRLAARAEPLLRRMPLVPQTKAMLTVNGGVCPEDGTRLEFDPWNPEKHRCPRCGRQYSGERHDRAWAHYQHLWLAERAAHLASVAAMSGAEAAAQRSNALLQAYRNYPEYPNRDNVLGPSRLFFSTYLESVWLTNYLAAAMLLRDAGQLEPETQEIVAAVADEAANLIADFDEGLSNRQTWHNAALSAVAVWFEDEELATRTIEGRSGMLTHLLRGFGPDGMWYEGDNYHLFALRGQLVAMGWARQAGVDMLADPQLAQRLGAALRAPALTALPDGTFPARKDSRFGVSLAQPMYLELWEVGLGRLERAGAPQEDLWNWLKLLYQSPAPPAQTFDAYLHEAGEATPAPRRTRADLSWWSLLEMVPALPSSSGQWSPGSTFIEGQGFAILRKGDRYAGLECGAYGGGHGHPDRLNLIFHAAGEYWLPDFGTGSYVARDLFWYRSSLAHNAPRLDGVSQPMGDAVCDNFEQSGEWGWARGRYGDLTRTLVAGPSYTLDILELSAADDHVLELPLHLSGRTEVERAADWVPAELKDEFVGQAERFAVSSEQPVRLTVTGETGARLGVNLHFSGELLRAVAPGAPGTPVPVPFYLVRCTGRHLRIVTVLEPIGSAPNVLRVQSTEQGIEVEARTGVSRHVATVEGWEVRTSGETVRLRGARKQPAPFEPLMQDRPLVASGVAHQVAEPPALDGSLEGFDTSSPLQLDHEDQYRRSEDPYAGPEELSAVAYVNWADEGLYVAVDVTKPELMLREPNAPPLLLDNEPDEIHADGIQLYLRLSADSPVIGLLVVPSSEGGLIVRGVDGTAGSKSMVRGGWSRTDAGYLVTVEVALPQWAEQSRPGDSIGFDLLINQMLPDRTRRAGQLVWSGGGGWVWLRGDRQDPSQFGTLELA
jgi:Heparinase II/III-like protein/Carbohydrate family 9 binding domain-like